VPQIAQALPQRVAKAKVLSVDIGRRSMDLE
jgi:hypothetical protein